jgi:hypothetical protein
MLERHLRRIHSASHLKVDSCRKLPFGSNGKAARFSRRRQVGAINFGAIKDDPYVDEDDLVFIKNECFNYREPG